MVIRKIQTKDSEIFLNMLKQLDNETKYMMYEPGERKTSAGEMKSVIESFYSSNSLMLAAEENGDLVGFLTAERGFANKIRHSAYIVIGLLKSHRGKKTGTRLFEELNKWAADNGITRLELTVMTHNEAAIGLYKKMGFNIEGLKENSLLVDGVYVDEYYMAKILL
ncbi:GNAT family N-acetyltransferase [Ruminiclostridium cellobioparum]|jgi:RimJ/RimL family protein N-acetyltransferase|uniref:GNAT family N-acetyltransferase n=1 Tax=Ruminiclostridium cellobioparum TaxID=29355 RepID=UPI000489E63C|nr:GNAT family N-acetyltransferase [Ruminiclostridium cellobioparum]